jgi:Protein of unknown function (DUF3761)
MRTTIAILAIGLSAIAGASVARTSHAYSHHYSHHAYHSGSDYYTNVSGHHVHRPVFASHAPRGASAQCGDGSYSFSEHHQGTCSHHGGVSSWL